MKTLTFILVGVALLFSLLGCYKIDATYGLDQKQKVALAKWWLMINNHPIPENAIVDMKEDFFSNHISIRVVVP